MNEAGVERRLTTLLAADVVGYSRLMGADQVGRFVRLKSLRIWPSPRLLAAMGVA